MHKIVLREKRLMPDDGLILGNGDISVSVYCDIGMIGFKLGKGDVWDRRMMYVADPEPVNIEEFSRGMQVEGWKCGPHGGTQIIATKAPAKDPERMQEVCQGVPPSYQEFPNPCPKPVGEFAMYIAPDLGYPVFDFELSIEEGILRVTAEFDGGYIVNVKICIDPEENLMLVEWKTQGFKDKKYAGCRKPPIRFALFRETDKDRDEYSDTYLMRHGYSPFFGATENKLYKPLDKPEVERMKGCEHPYIVQRFAPDLTYPKGFEYVMTVFGKANYRIAEKRTGRTRGFSLSPEDPYEGTLFVGLESTGEDGTRALKKLLRLRDLTNDKEACANDVWNRLKEYNEAFWSASSIETEDEIFEKGWYETIYLQRCVYKSGKQAPGLFMPSTVDDYSYWHGDYHTNYNIQQPFWGMPSSNHIELMKPYLELMIKWFLPLGKLIAEKYYHCRGCFIQLSGYPMIMADDPLGVLPMGRMAYMTGFSMEYFWQYYRYTMDIEYLRETGYPFMRECALFYYDFLTLGEDGYYHAFPSNQGEDGFTGDGEEYRDCSEVILFIRQCLYFAIKAAEIVSPGDELLAGWKERYEKLAPPRGEEWPQLSGLARHRYECSDPRFGKVMTPYDGGNYLFTEEHLPKNIWMDCADWYFGHDIDFVMLPAIRKGGLEAQTVYSFTRQEMNKWRTKNGAFIGMTRAIYGHSGIFTETFGITGVIGEMLVQSFDGAIGVFPCWPLNKKMRFCNLRAEGAFLVSAACETGMVAEIEIFSEKGGLCAMYLPESMRVTCAGKEIPVRKDEFGRPAFETMSGHSYKISM